MQNTCKKFNKCKEIKWPIIRHCWKFNRENFPKMSLNTFKSMSNTFCTRESVFLMKNQLLPPSSKIDRTVQIMVKKHFRHLGFFPAGKMKKLFMCNKERGTRKTVLHEGYFKFTFVLLLTGQLGFRTPKISNNICPPGT